MCCNLFTRCQFSNKHLHLKMITGSSFRKYGAIHDVGELSDYIAFLNRQEIGASMGDETYIPSSPELEEMITSMYFKTNLFGAVDCQIGWYTGKANKLNALEFHKCAEILYLISPAVLLLGAVGDLECNTYHSDRLDAFFVPALTCVELFSSTLHFSPLAVMESGVRQIVVQQKNTNTPNLVKVDKKLEIDRLLLERNKWVIAHAEAKSLVDAGAYVGLVGENTVLYQLSNF